MCMVIRQVLEDFCHKSSLLLNFYSTFILDLKIQKLVIACFGSFPQLFPILQSVLCSQSKNRLGLQRLHSKKSKNTLTFSVQSSPANKKQKVGTWFISLGRREVFQLDPFALARIKHGGPQPEFPEHPVRFPVTLVSLRRSSFYLPSSSAAPRGSALGSATAGLLPAPTRGPAHQPAPANRRPRCGGWQRRPAPPLSLAVACGSRAGSAAVGREDGWCGTAGRGRSPPATAQPSVAEAVSPEPPPWTSKTVSGASGWSPRRAGGGVAAPGVCLRSQDGRVGFVLRARRPPARRGPSARNRPVWEPARLVAPARRPLPPGTWEFRAGLGEGKGAPRAPRPPVSGPGLALRTRPGRGAWKLPRRLPTPRSRARGAGGASPASRRVRLTGRRPSSSA